MASLVGKRRGGRTYYYLVESARVAGKPRIVAQQYLGSAEELAARLSSAGPGEPARTHHQAFGDLAAAWQVLQQLQVARVIDEQVGSRRADAAASVGTYLALAALNRVVAPRSKLAFASWWQATAGDRLVKLPVAALDHRRFWDAMDALSVKALRAAERAIAARMVEVFDLDLAGLVLDMTNFATLVDSANQRNTIAARGHAKQKRFDLRLVGVGLVVTADGRVPVLSHAYQGNRPDVTQFSAVTEELVARFGALARAPMRSPWSTTPAATRPTAKPRWRPARCTLSAACAPRTIPTCWPSRRAAFGWSTLNASQVSRRWRPIPTRWAPTGG